MKLKMLIFALSYLGRYFFVHFLGELKKPKSLFEINWPLVGFHRELRSELGNCMHWRLTALDTLGRVRAASEAAAGGWRAIVFTSDADDEVTISYPGLYHTLSAICEAVRRRQHRWGQQARRGAARARLEAGEFDPHHFTYRSRELGRSSKL